MGANDYQGNLTPSPENEPEQKKKKGNKKKAVLLGLAALVVLGGASVLCRSGITDRPQPPRQEQEASEVAVVVEPTDTMEADPTPTHISKVVPAPLDYRQSWLGNYEGVATGVRYFQWNDNNNKDVWEFEDFPLWLKITKWEDCGEGETWAVCNPDLSWGIYAGTLGCSDSLYTSNVIRLYLPEDPSDAPGLNISEARIIIDATEEYPYEVVIAKSEGQVVGSMFIDWDNPEFEAIYEPDERQKVILDNFETESTIWTHHCQSQDD